MGWTEWRKETTRRHDWGLHDTDLVRQAVRRLDDLKARAPFHLSILTVNTHPPGFVAPDCPDGEQNPSLLLAVRCTDTAVGMLLDELESRGHFKNSVIAVLGDHTVMPSADNLKALQGDLVGWFGKVYMALWYPDVSPRVVRTVGYTPDFAPLVLDALNFDPVPLFQFGRSTMRDADFQRTLVARHFQIVDGEMHPREPTLMDNCDLRQLEQTIIDTKDSAILSSCERQRLVQIVENAAESR